MARTAPPRASRQNGDDWRLAQRVQRQWRVEDFFAAKRDDKVQRQRHTKSAEASTPAAPVEQKLPDEAPAHKFFASRKTAPANRLQAKLFERARKAAVKAENKAQARQRKLSQTASSASDQDKRKRIDKFNAPRQRSSSSHKNAKTPEESDAGDSASFMPVHAAMLMLLAGV